MFVCAPAAFSQGTWVQQPTALQAAPTTFVQVGGLWGVAMTDTGTGFAAGYASVANGFSGVLRKLPGNPTWFVLPSANFAALPNSHSLWSAVTAVGTHVWVCGSNGRIYKTTNNGNNWVETRNGITGTNTFFDIFFKNQNEGMVIGDNGAIYYTSDGGANWMAQTLPVTVASATQLYGVHSAGSNWYVSGGTNTFMRGNPASSSTSWVDLTANLPGIGGIEGLQFLNDNVGTIGGVTVTGSAVYRTTNAGTSWSPIAASLGGGLPYNGLFFFHPDTGWVANSATNINRTVDGGQNWTLTNSTPISGQTLSNWITRIAFPSRDIGFASGGAPGTSSLGWILRYQRPPLPDISTTPDSLAFGTLDCDTTTTKVFTIHNSGNTVLNISQLTFNPPDFTIVGPTPTSVPASGGVTFTIRWTPSIPGALPPGAGMTVMSDDLAHNPWFVRFTGSWNVGSFTIGDAYDFGTTCISDSIDINMILTVTGNLAPKIIGFEHVNGPSYVSLITPSVGSTISGTQQFTFRAKPTVGGSISSVYRMIYGNPLCPKQKLITFTALVSNADLSLNPVVVNFGDVCIGETKDIEITVTNNGTSPGVISSRILASGKDVFPNQHFTPFGPIPPGESRQYTVRFAPGTLDTGNVEAEYKLVVDPCRDTLLLTLRGRGVKPAITFTPTSVLGIGPVPTGQVSEENVFITNSGNATLNISDITLAPVHPRLTMINVPSLPRMLPPGQSMSVRVRFSPDRVETIQANLCVHWSSPCADSSCLPVAATSGTAPTIDVAASLNLGVQLCVAEIRDTLWVHNVGGGTLTITRLLLGGNDPGHFTIHAPTTPKSILSGDSVAVIISFMRPENGASSAELTIEHNDSKVGGISKVALSAVRDGADFAVQADSLSSFVSCANVGLSRTYRIQNRGIRNLEVHEITMLTGFDVFHVSSTPLPSTIPGGSGLSFEVNFTPTGKGVFTGTIRVIAGECHDSYLVSLFGQGNISEVSFTPNPVDFGSVDVGDSDTRIVTITNNGATAVSISDVYLPPGTTEFSLTAVPTLPTIINPGASRNVTVRFAPQSVGNLSTNVCIAITAPCPDTLCVTVRGRGNSTGLGVTKTRMDFQLDPCSMDERCDSIEIVNNAGTVVNVTDVRVEPVGGFNVSLPGALPLQLANGASVTLRVCAQADFTGSRTRNLVIVSDDANVPLIRVPLNALRDSSAIRVTETVVDFGSIAPCESGVSKFITVTNSGTLSEFLDTLRRSEVFVVSTVLPVALQPGALTQVRISFTPPDFGVFEDTLYFTTARCGLRVPLIVRGSMWESNYDVVPVPLTFTSVPVGSNQILNFTFENLHLPSVRISDVQISPAGAFASWGAYPKTVNVGSTVQLPIQYTPLEAGPHSATACIIIDQPCPDTICVQIQGSTGDGGLAALPDKLDFGIVPQCSDTFMTDTLRNGGSTDVTLQSARIEGPDAAYFSIENPITAPELLGTGTDRIFRIRALATIPPVDGNYAADLVVETGSAVQPQITVSLRMQRLSLIAPDDDSIDFGTVFVGTSTTRSITLENRGTLDVLFTDASIPSGVTVLPALPITIPAGGQVTLDVTLTPAAAGSVLEVVELKLTNPCTAQTRIELRGTAQDAFGLTAFDFGMVPICRPTTITQEALRNNTTNVAAITAARFEGGDAPAFTLLQPNVFPIDIPGGSPFTPQIQVTPNPLNPPRIYQAVLVLTFDIDSHAQEIRIPVSADARESVLTGPAGLSFGIVSVGTIAGPFTVDFMNEFSYPVTLDSVFLYRASSMAIRLIGTNPALPAIIPPGGKLQLTFEYEPAIGLPTDENEYRFAYSAPCADSRSFIVSGMRVDDAIRATLRIAEHSASVDDVVEVPVLLEQDLGGTAVTSWEGSITFNRSMLHPIEVTAESTLSSGMQLAMSYDYAAGRLHLRASGGTLSGGTGALALVRFKVLVGNAISTPLRIDQDFAFTSGRAKVESRIDGKFTLLDYCDADGARLISDTGGMLLRPNRPNPFAGSTVIEYSTTKAGPVDLRVYDRMGREVAMLVHDSAHPAGAHRVTFDATQLPPGVYFAVLRSGTESVVRKMLRME